MTLNPDVHHVDVIFLDLKMKFATQRRDSVLVKMVLREDFVIVAFKTFMALKVVKDVRVSNILL